MDETCEETPGRMVGLCVIRTKFPAVDDAVLSTLEQATILLAANLAFLSVPNTILFSSESDPSGVQWELVSPAAILSYSSLMASIGSMTIGLLLIRQHRGEEIIDNPRAVSNYLRLVCCGCVLNASFL